MIVTTPFARNGPGNYTDLNGIVQTALADVLRNAHYVGGVLQPPLIEPARANSLWPSRNFAGTWTQSFSPAPTFNAVGLDGTPNSATTLTDSDGVNFSSINRSQAILNDSATHCLSVWFRKDSDQTRFPQCKLQLTGGTFVQRAVAINTVTGAVSLHNSAGVGTFRTVDAGLWWILEITCTNNSTGNTTATVSIYPAAGITLGADNGAGVGSCVVGQAQLELNATAYSSPIFTTVAAVARAADIDQMFAATANGYTRQIGSFLAEGFLPRMIITPHLFTSNPVDMIASVTDLQIVTNNPRTIESALAGRSITSPDMTLAPAHRDATISLLTSE